MVQPTPASKGQRIQKWFDTSCFSVPAPFTYGTDSRANPDVRGPSFTQLDIGLTKQNKIMRERASLVLRVEAFNLFNTPHFAPPELGADNSNFGQISVITGKPRVLQFAAKMMF